MKITWRNEIRNISGLKPAAYNPRKHDKKQFAELSKSIEKFDLADPIIINADNTVIGGHLRIRALTAQGTRTIEVRVPDRQLTDQEEKELNIRLNKNQGEFDLELLANFDDSFLKDIGFDSAELDTILTYRPETGMTDDDDIPETAESVCKTGDLWQLGDHRLLCGNSMKKEDVDKLMDGKLANLVSTDPPFGVNYTGDDRPQGGKDWKNLFHDVGIQDYERFLREFLACATANANPNAAWYIWHAEKTRHILYKALEDSGILVHQTIIWKKPRWIPTHTVYNRQYEPCLFGWKKGFKPVTYVEHKYLSDVWDVFYDDGKKASVGKDHPTQKPVELFEIPIMAHTQREDVCLEPFAGSGTQFIAAEKTSRICYGTEIEPHFCDVIIKRWETFTGKKAMKIA